MTEIGNFTIIGTRSSLDEIRIALGYSPFTYNPEVTRVLREIIVLRAYYKKSKANKIRFYLLPIDEFERRTNEHLILLEAIKTGLSWAPDVAFEHKHFLESKHEVDKLFSFGIVDSHDRTKYVSMLSSQLGAKMFKISMQS